jgi:hypothetical protein
MSLWIAENFSKLFSKNLLTYPAGYAMMSPFLLSRKKQKKNRKIEKMHIFFKSQKDYHKVCEALTEAFAIGYSLAQKGIPMLDDDGEETAEYMDAINSIISIKPVYPSQEIERIYDSKTALQKAVFKMAQDTGEFPSTEQINHLFQQIEKEKEESYDLLKQYEKGEAK